MSDDTAETRTPGFIVRPGKGGPTVTERPHSHSGKGSRSLDTPWKKMEKDQTKKTRREEGEKEIEAGRQEDPEDQAVDSTPQTSPPPPSSPPPKRETHSFSSPSSSRKRPPTREEKAKTAKAQKVRFFSQGGDRGPTKGKFGKE